MTKDEFIKKWGYQKEEFTDSEVDETLDKIHGEFISDLDDLMAWYKHELWDKWNNKTK